MSTTDETKAVLRRWYDEMWGQQNWRLVTEIAGPTYTRHETGGTTVLSAEEYQAIVQGVCDNMTVSDLVYDLIGEGDRVVALGQWKLDGDQWDWVQAFRVEHGKIVETWLSGIATESNWAPSVVGQI